MKVHVNNKTRQQVKQFTGEVILLQRFWVETSRISTMGGANTAGRVAEQQQ